MAKTPKIQPPKRQSVTRFDVWLVALDPTLGSEIRKTRPCVIVSPDELNDPLNTVIVAPLTSMRKGWPHRVDCHFSGVDGELATEQLRAIDKSRLHKKIGNLDEGTATKLADRLVAMFAF